MVSLHKRVCRTNLTGGEQMDAATRACAPSGWTWHGINWADAQRQVRRLQTRMVKATQGGRHNKVKALQWLLTHSFSGKALAVKRVTENEGKNTPGVDKVTWKTPVAKTNAIASLKRRGYSPLPLRRVFILKKNGKTRPLGIPAMKCRAMQALHLLALEPIAETTADLNSYAFRPERSTADAGEQCFNALAKKTSAEWVLEADIRSCFDNISHDWMIANVPTDKVILKRWLKAGFVYQNVLFPTDAGTPQGGIITPWTQKVTSSLSERCDWIVQYWLLTYVANGNTIMTYGPLHSHRKGSALERGRRPDRPRSEPQRGRRGFGRGVRAIAAPSVPLFAAGAGDQASGACRRAA